MIDRRGHQDSPEGSGSDSGKKNISGTRHSQRLKGTVHTQKSHCHAHIVPRLYAFSVENKH